MNQKIFYSCRLNSFESNFNKHAAQKLVTKLSTLKDLSHVDLNYPRHINLIPSLKKSRLKINSIQPRFYENKIFSEGGLSSEDKNIRLKAIEFLSKSIEIALHADCNLITIWLDSDGFWGNESNDTYKKKTLNLQNSLEKISSKYPHIFISLEYKPFDPLPFFILNNAGTTLDFISQLRIKKQFGVTVDFCHSLINI